MVRVVVGLFVIIGAVTLGGCGGSRFVDPVLGEQFRYGDDRKHVAVLARPAGDDALPVVVLIHGGFWRDGFALDLMAPLATDLVARGYGVWNIEYRGVGQAGGGYPETLDDVKAAIEFLPTIAGDYGLDVDRVAFVGHSAGGHLALWASGADLAVDPVLTVGQAAVVDLYRAADANLGRGAAQALLGGEPDEVPDAYAAAQPLLDDRVLLVHGDADDIVPVDQSTLADAETVVVAGEGHFAHLDVESASWAAVVDALDERLAVSPAG